jgi:hypothetical protein
MPPVVLPLPFGVKNTVIFQTKVVCSAVKPSAIIVVHPAFHFSPVYHLTG